MKRLFNRNRWFSSTLDIFGLTVAFTAFMVIMIQVRYDWRYDRNYPGHERIFRLEFLNDPTDAGSYSTTICRPFIENLKHISPDIEAVGAYQYYKNSYSEWSRSGEPQDKFRLQSSGLDKDILKVFPFVFTEGDTSAFSGPGTAIISESAAGILFPGKSPVGQMVDDMDYGGTYRIAAVYKDFPENSSVPNGILTQLGTDCLDDWSEWSFQCYMKLYGSSSRNAVDSLITTRMIELLTETEDEKQMLRDGVRITNLHDAYFSKDISGDPMGKGNKTTTGSLFLIGIVIIAIAIINSINFSTASVPLTIKDINTRKVLGSGRGALIWRQLSEALVLAVTAFGLSVLALYVISGTPFTSYISGSMEIGDNTGIILLGAAVSVFTAFFTGIFPALYSTSFQPALVLKGAFSLSPKGRALRVFMVGFQFVASFVLITMTLFIQVQTSFMKHKDMGFTRDQVVVFGVGGTIGNKAEGFEQKLKQNPHILDVTFAGNMLVSNSKMGWGRSFNGQRVQLDVLPVASDFIGFFGMQIKEGRNFTPADDLDPDGTFIMNEQTMRRFPFLRLGARLDGHADEPAEIVGIVKDFNFKPLQYGIDPIALYVFGSKPWWPLSVVYAKISPEDIPETFRYIREAIEEFNPEINGDDVYIRFLDESIGNLYAKETKLNRLIAITAVLSLIISLVGILGIVSFETQFRRKEIALRKVHGASVSGILKMINRQYIIQTLVCFVISVPVACFIMKRWVSGFAYQAPVPVWIFIAAIAAVLAVTVLTVTLQSRRAATQNPVESLRTE